MKTCILLIAILSAQHAGAQHAGKKAAPTGQATLQDSMDVYNNAKAVQDFYERTGQYTKTHETRLNGDDPAKQHAGNDKKYAAVLSTINDLRLTPQGKRRIRPEEYRINIDQYRYKQRELSDYVLNTDAPMQLFDRRIAPQVLVDYAFTSYANSALNADDVDFKMYDPVAIKPYSKLTPGEKAVRETKYPKPLMQYHAPAPTIVREIKPPKKTTRNEPKSNAGTEFFIGGSVPDSLRTKRFKSRRQAEEFIKTLSAGSDSE